jgi:hypothetical protein
LEPPPTEEHGCIVGHAIEKKIVENLMLQQPSFLDVSTHFVYSFSFVKCPGQEETAHRAMPGRKTRGKKSEILSKYTKTPSLHQIEMILLRNTNSPRKKRAKKERKTNNRNDHRVSSTFENYQGEQTYFFVNRIMSLPIRIEPL